MPFSLQAPFTPAGEQPHAIDATLKHLQERKKHQAILGVTGSGKTFTVAHIIAASNCPALIIAPNKTLAAQLFSELKEFFPQNQVEFFISYYDYYQPEAYVVSTDTYIEKESSINDDIDKMRHQATRALFECRDTIIVASVSCIYGLGSPENYAELICPLEVGQKLVRDAFLRRLLELNYRRAEQRLERGNFQVRGDTVDVLPAHQEKECVRIDFFGDEIAEISLLDVLTRKEKPVDSLSLYPNSHYLTQKKHLPSIVKEILHDLGKQLRKFKEQGNFLALCAMLKPWNS